MSSSADLETEIEEPIRTITAPTPALRPAPVQPAAAASVVAAAIPSFEVPGSIWYETSKRILDVFLATTSLIALSPLLLVTAALIKLSDRGPVLFAQIRVGRGGRHFRFYKFRSMVTEAESLKQDLQQLNHHEEGITFKIPKDPRMTRMGFLLRKASIDELPQLWNVLVGHMSIVGPRPPVPEEVAKYSPYQLRRLAVKPGLTCTWQVGGRSDVPFSRQVAMDIEYIEQRSFWRDLVLILRTVPAVLSGKGAY